MTIISSAVRSIPTGQNHPSTEGGETAKSEPVIRMKREMKNNVIMEEFNYRTI